MKQLKANMVLSIDGFIAYKDGDINWIPKVVSNAIQNEINQADTLLMGANTYTQIFEHNGYMPFKNKKLYVISHYEGNIAVDKNIEFLTVSPMKVIDVMKRQAENDLLVIGGGNFISSLIDNELLDKLSIHTVPVILGEGIPFLRASVGSSWELHEFEKLGDIVHTSYKLKKRL
jgi:dihydrofolate reductase